MTELANSILHLLGYHITLSTTIGVLLHHSLWILLIGKVFDDQKKANYILAVFFVFWLLNVILYDSW
ncbi:MAG TPA: hypothetical protein VGB43_01700, partial [Flavobacterium sp.]